MGQPGRQGRACLVTKEGNNLHDVILNVIHARNVGERRGFHLAACQLQARAAKQGVIRRHGAAEGEGPKDNGQGNDHGKQDMGNCDLELLEDVFLVMLDGHAVRAQRHRQVRIVDEAHFTPLPWVRCAVVMRGHDCGASVHRELYSLDAAFAQQHQKLCIRNLLQPCEVPGGYHHVLFLCLSRGRYAGFGRYHRLEGIYDGNPPLAFCTARRHRSMS